MAVKCPTCGSGTTQALVHQNQCLSCGELFDFHGNVEQAGPSRADRDAAIARANRSNAPVVIGNIADLQRSGADAAKAGDIVLPQGVRAENVVTPAEDDARKGEVTVETERVGLKVGDQVTTSGSTRKASTKK